MCFCSVLEMRVESSMNWMDPEKFVDLYLAGRSKRTFLTYDMAFRKILAHTVSLRLVCPREIISDTFRGVPKFDFNVYLFNF